MICPKCNGDAYIERRKGGNAFEVRCKKCGQWFMMKSLLIAFDPDTATEDNNSIEIHIRNPILYFALEMERIMAEHDSEKADSWKECDMEYLADKIAEEYKEWENSLDINSFDSDPAELIDLANMCMMVWNRLQGDAQ